MKTFKSSVLLRRIDKLEKAAIEKSWIGSKPPEDHAKIEQDYKKARLDLISYVIEHVL